MLRVRPILMTTFAFIAGLTPLMFAVGPSAKGNQSISIGTSGGLLFGVIITVFVVPALFVFFQKLDEKIRSEEHTSELQSRPHLVCRLLLEKKKQQNCLRL